MVPAALMPASANAESAKQRAKENKVIAAKAQNLGSDVLALFRSSRKTHAHGLQTWIEQQGPNEREITVTKTIPGPNAGEQFTYRVAAIMKRSKSGALLPKTTTTVGGDVYLRDRGHKDAQITQSFGVYNLEDNGIHGWSAESTRFASDGQEFKVQTDSTDVPYAPGVNFSLSQLAIVRNDIGEAIDVMAGIPSGE